MLELVAHDQPVAARLTRELEAVAHVFEHQLASDLSAVNTLCMHVERYRGKMLRPTLVLLSSLVAKPDDPERALTPHHHVLAAVTEMIHMATLVHDDVLDEAAIRRGGATVNHLWGNEAAVMLGDYLISNAFQLCSTIGKPEINLALGHVTNTLCEGELAQLHHRHDTSLDETTYFDIIRRKTASLIAACCRLGALLAGASEHEAAALGRTGEALGIAFQIQDDLLDLVGEEEVVGKSLGRDLSKGKLTLPLILHLERAEPVERARALELIKNCDAAGLRLALVESDTVAAARNQAVQFVDDARSSLAQLPKSPARTLFETLAEAIVTRSF